MADDNEIAAHVGDVGLVLKATVVDENDAVVNISSATVLTLKLEDPYGTTTSKTASFYTDGADGILKYATLAADLHVQGRWLVQGYVEMTGRKFHTSKEVLPVEDNLT